MSSNDDTSSTEPPSQLQSNLQPVKVRYVALPHPLQPLTSTPTTVVATNEMKPPCRRCLKDAQPGETLTLIDYDPFPPSCTTPYRGRGPIFVHAAENPCELFTRDKIPGTQLRRLMSLRAYDEGGMLVAAEVVDGNVFESAVGVMLADEKARYVNVHNAKPGCFAFTAVRA